MLELFMTEVVVSDWPGSVRWYADVLGLGELLRDEANGFALLGAGPCRLALKRGTDSASARGSFRLVFRVEDVDAERARLTARGVFVSDAVENEREGFREVRLSDPEGTPITLFGWTARKPAPGA